ncbi:cyclin-dependent kinase 11B-like [Spodoptera frugiperda]|uniref:Cyclin-dependent kinase 11B-like n=1 Tax=Spodoptera frugiperda TaxID=7108 RepID=A0A9R0DSH1_SPOFR|nr:cyclin-dependent kinase 11B-like [Spodoptera frugiperda]
MTSKRIKKQKQDIIDVDSPFHPAFQSCRSVDEFQYLYKIDEGSFGVIHGAKDKQTGELVALKHLKKINEREGYTIAARRELEILHKMRHPNIVADCGLASTPSNEQVFIVMELVNYDLKAFMDTMYSNMQLFSVEHFTPDVVTRWYPAPEILLLFNDYSSPVDMWSVGCIFAELITLWPLFPGSSELDQMTKIFKTLGTPSDSIWPGYSESTVVRNLILDDYPPGGLRKEISQELLSEDGLSLLQCFLTYDPSKRITAAAALEHAYFNEQPVAVEPAMFLESPARSAVMPG